MEIPKASLLVEDDERKEFPLDAGPLLIGSGDVCKLILKGNGCASFTHADIRWDTGSFVLNDLGSRDGTRVNGARVNRYVLRNGDRVLIGGVKLTFLQPQEEPPPPPAPAAGDAPARERVGETTDRLPPLQMILLSSDEETQRERRETLGIGIAAAVLVLAFLASLPLFFGDGPQETRGAIPWVQVTCEQGQSAFVTLQHERVRALDPKIVEVSSSGDARNQISIAGLAPGKTKVLADGDKGQLWEITVNVTPHEDWPPGWTDADRLAAAEKLLKEAAPLYQDRAQHEVNLVALYYRYAKICRFYRNCRYAPATPDEEAQERCAELEKRVTARELTHVRELFRNFRSGNLPTAKAHLQDLLALFPEDGGDDHVMDCHGNAQKHQQYFVLGLKLEELSKAMR